MMAITFFKYCKLCNNNLPAGWNDWQTCPHCGYALWDEGGAMRWMGWRVKGPEKLSIRPRVRISLVSADEERDGKQLALTRLHKLELLQASYPGTMPIEVRLLTPYVMEKILTLGAVWVPEAEVTQWAEIIRQMGVDIDLICLEVGDVRPDQLGSALKDLEDLKKEYLKVDVNGVEPDELLELLDAFTCRGRDRND